MFLLFFFEVTSNKLSVLQIKPDKFKYNPKNYYTNEKAEFATVSILPGKINVR